MKCFYILFLLPLYSFSQTNFSFSNAKFEDYIKGNFDSSNFEKRNILIDQNFPEWINNEIKPDSLSIYLRKIISYKNRNTVNDTISEPEKGIRGARKMISSYLTYWNDRMNSVIEQTEFSFDYSMCDRLRHTQLMSFIPGNGPNKKEIVIIEAHLDSRCENRCDINCLAEGAEDNGSGSAMMMELARILSRVELNRSIVIIWITGEEQGLGGSRSFAVYCKSNGIKIKAVFNNDIVGGIECGKTSSPPSCPGPFKYDSTHLRIFSSGTTNSMHKSLARLSKLLFEHNENILSPIQLDVMFAEDRTGRGSDHIPFRENGFTALRYTSSFEHGDGNPDQVGYEDRQHSTRDVLGKDFDGDGILDSLYVNFSYLANNTFVNAITACNASANRNIIPSLTAATDNGKLIMDLTSTDSLAKSYIYCVRKLTAAYYDTIIKSSNIHIEVVGLPTFQYYVSVFSVDKFGWMSMSSTEVLVKITNSVTEVKKEQSFLQLWQNQPNPFDDQTMIPILVNDISKINSAQLLISDRRGMTLQRKNLELKEGLNEILFDIAHYNSNQIYFYSLVINGVIVKTLEMQLLNY